MRIKFYLRQLKFSELQPGMTVFLETGPVKVIGVKKVVATIQLGDTKWEMYKKFNGYVNLYVPVYYDCDPNKSDESEEQWWNSVHPKHYSHIEQYLPKNGNNFCVGVLDSSGKCCNNTVIITNKNYVS